MAIPTVAGGTFVDVGVQNVHQEGDEILEVWLRPYAGGVGVTGALVEFSPGVFIGATDFSEYTADVGLGAIPAGLTLDGDSSFPDVLDEGGAEGIAIKQGGNVGAFMISVDAWDGVFRFGEMLARVLHTGGGSGIRSYGGPAGYTPVADAYVGAQMTNGGVVSGISDAGSQAFVGTSSDAHGASSNSYVWIRIRITDAGGGNVNIKIDHSTAAADSPPPVPTVWDIDEDIVLEPLYDTADPTTNVVGFLRRTVGPIQTADRKMSFLSFTTDPSTKAGPGTVAEAGGLEPGDWYLAASVAVAAVEDQVVNVADLDEGTLHDVALRYRRGVLYNPGAENTADPTTWPSVSRGQFTTTVDPPTFVSAVWARTASDAEEIVLTVTPVSGQEEHAINVYREKAGEGAPTLIGTISGPHVGDAEFTDDTIEGEAVYFYSFSTAPTGTEGALSTAQRVWSGPAGIPVFLYQNVVGGGYVIGFTPGDVTLETELEDTYNNLGGETSFGLRATAAAAAVEVNSGALVNVPAPNLTFSGRLRHKATAFTTDDFGEYSSPTFSITVPESE